MNAELEFDMQSNCEFYDGLDEFDEQYHDYFEDDGPFEFDDSEDWIEADWYLNNKESEDQYYYDVYGMSKKEYEANERYLSDVNRMIEQDEVEQVIEDGLSDDEEDYGGFVKIVRTKTSRSKEGKKSNEKNKNNIRNNNKRNWEFNDED